MQNEIIHPALLAFPYDRGHFDNFRASAQDYCSAHVSHSLNAGITATLFELPIDTNDGYDYSQLT
jgi:hypothetical protein